MPAQVSMLAQAREASQRKSLELSSPDALDTTEPGSGSPKKQRKRIRHFTSGDRAAHRVFERGRREAFRAELLVRDLTCSYVFSASCPRVVSPLTYHTQELAALLPSLKEADASRLSKHTVVHASISQHHEQRQQIDALTQERDALQAEVTRWRAQSHLQGQASPVPLASAMAVPLPLADVPPNVAEPPTIPEPSTMPENTSWSWDAPLALPGELGDSDTSLAWDGLAEADLSQVVNVVPHGSPGFTRDGTECDIDNVFVASAMGLLDAVPTRQLSPAQWMVS